MSLDKSLSFSGTELKGMVQAYFAQLNPTHRYASFDYCYNYFHPSTDNDISNNMEFSCLQIGFYLASWGMYRGSSGLLQKSVKHFVPLIEYISKADERLWLIDVDRYDENNIQLLLKTYADLKEIVPAHMSSSHLTLVTKVMLGVFGCVPAFDSYFTKSFRELSNGQCGFRSFNENALLTLRDFYNENTGGINEISENTNVLSFNGNDSQLKYTKAKVLDMFGFMYSNVR